MHVPLRARAPRLLLLAALAGLTACQAAAGTPLPKNRLATPPTTAALEVPTSAPAPPAPAAPALTPPTLGPLAQRLAPDLIVHGPGLGPAQFGQITGLVPAGQTTLLRQGQVVLALADGPHPLPAAGVDPAAFRAFTPPGTAEVTAVWDAAVRGELVVSHEAAHRLGLSLGGMVNVTLPGGAASPLRVGAFADTGLAGVDVVVAGPLADQLGLPGPNAVLLAAGAANLSAVTKAVKAALPKTAVLDALNHAVVTGHAFMTGSDAAKAFGVLPYQQYPDGTILPDPAWVRANIVRAQVPIIGAVTCNRLMIPQLAGALRDIVNAGLAAAIHPDQYEGCYVPKLIEDSNSISMHTWGLAVDLNVPTNQRGTNGDMDPRVVTIFKSWGFRWGGDYVHSPPDPMHFELIALVRH